MRIYPKETLIILGAGASKDCGAPLIDNFLPTAFSDDVIDKLSGEDEDKFNNVKKFWNKVLPESNIEELIGLISLQLKFPSTMGGFDPNKSNKASDIVDRVMKLDVGHQRDYCYIENPEFNKENLEPILNDSNFLISKTLSIVLELDSEKKEKAFKAYINLAKRYKESIVITFNWDVLVENAFNNVLNDKINVKNLGFENDFKYPLILKLHGSLSWLICPKCKTPIVVEEKVHHYPIEDLPFCQRCLKEDTKKIQMIHFKVLPIIDKLNEIKDNGFYFAQVWKHARQHLKKTKRIIVIGYSINPADLHVKLFLKKNIIDNKYLREIWFVKPKKDKLFEERALDLLGVKDAKKYRTITDMTLKYKLIEIREPNKIIDVKFINKSFSEFFNVAI